MIEGILVIAISEDEADVLNQAARSLAYMEALTRNPELGAQGAVVSRIAQRVRFTESQYHLFAGTQPTAEEVGKPSRQTGASSR